MEWESLFRILEEISRCSQLFPIPNTTLAPNACVCNNFMVRDATRILKQTGR